MNWEAFGATGEWAGATAVVITLIYLARQIRQQNKIAKFDAYQSIMDGFRNLTLTQGTNAELNTLMAKGSKDPKSLNDTEALQYSMLSRAYFTNMNKVYHAHKLNFVDDQLWHDLAIEFASILDHPGGIAFRASVEWGFKEFWAAIDAVNQSGERRPDFNLNRNKKKN
jgi:hypothetical protein